MNPFGDNLKLIAALENIDKEFTEDGDEDDHEDWEDDGMVWHVNENGERILLEVQNDILFYNNTQGIKGGKAHHTIFSFNHKLRQNLPVFRLTMPHFVRHCLNSFLKNFKLFYFM